MKKILLAFGTRPEAIKMAPLVKEFQRHKEHFDTIVCVTAQHRELLDQVLKVFGIIPDYDLDIMTKGQDLFDTSSKILLEMRDLLSNLKPDVVFVHGDTTTSFVVALAAFYLKIAVAHVEAGLRSKDIYSPWPEEMYRQLTARIAKYHFAPTENSKNNLLAENIDENAIVVTGNTVIDTLSYISKTMSKSETLREKLRSVIACSGYEMTDRKYLVLTMHRRENFGTGLTNICEAVKRISVEFPSYDVVYPVHLNPNIQKPVKDHLENMNNVYLLPPLEYMPFLFLISSATVLVTDSGGIQEEATCLGVPVVMLRKVTDRQEALASGIIKLVGTDVEKILSEIYKLLNNDVYYAKRSRVTSVYGDGNASEHIVNFFI